MELVTGRQRSPIACPYKQETAGLTELSGEPVSAGFVEERTRPSGARTEPRQQHRGPVCDGTGKRKEKACRLCFENYISHSVIYSKTFSHPDKSAGHFLAHFLHELAGFCCINTDTITLTWPSPQQTRSKDERHGSFQILCLVKLKLLANVITLSPACVYEIHLRSQEELKQHF